MKEVKITMKDIAEAFKVSVSTVSRALNGSSVVSSEKREKIRQYAIDHHFNVNSLAQDLRNARTQRSHTIGVIVPELSHYFFSAVLSGIEAEATRRGYNILLRSSHENYDDERDACLSLMEKNVCGIIVSLSKTTTVFDHFRELQRNNVALVFYDRICHGINASRVVVDDYHGAFSAVSHLLNAGAKRVAFCGSPLKLEIVKNRLNGYRDALLKQGLCPDDSLVLNCDTRAKAEELIPSILTSDNRPDAFFAVNDDAAVGVIHVAKRLGLRVPEDIMVCGFTNGERALACDPMLTTVDQRGAEMGRQAADVLIKKVEGIIPIDKVEKRLVRTSLVKRGTTR